MRNRQYIGTGIVRLKLRVKICDSQQLVGESAFGKIVDVECTPDLSPGQSFFVLKN